MTSTFMGRHLEFADKLVKKIKCPWRIYLSETDTDSISLTMYFRNHAIFKEYAKCKNNVHRIFISSKKPEKGIQFAGLFLRR